MQIFLGLILVGSWALAASPKEKKDVGIEFVLKSGEVAGAAVVETLQPNSIDEMKKGKLVRGGRKLYETDKGSVPFYSVKLQLEPDTGQRLEAITAANLDKKLILKAEKLKITEFWIKNAVGLDPLEIEPERSKYDPKSDGTKESAYSKGAAEKLVAQLKPLLKKK